MPSTPNPKPQIHLLRPDFEQHRQEAAGAVAAELGRIADPVTLLERSTEIITEAEEEIAENSGLRDAAALSLWAYEAAWGVEQSMGLSRTAWVKIRRAAMGLESADPEPDAHHRAAAARAAGIKQVPDAADSLPRIALRLEAARSRIRAAREHRDAAVRVLRKEPYGWSQQKISGAINRKSQLVTYIERGGAWDRPQNPRPGV